MKVVHTVASLRADHGGPARTIGSLCAALGEAGVDVELLTRAPGLREAAPLVPGSHVPTTFVSGGTGAMWLMSNGFRRAVEQRLSDARNSVLHDHGLWLPTNHAMARVARNRRVQRVVSVRGMLSRWALSQRPAKKRLAWAAYQRRDLASADVLHATADAELEELRAAGLRQPVAVIPNGCLLSPRRRHEPRGDRPRRALFLSRLHPKKGLPHLLHAWAAVRPAGWELLIAGPDEGGHRGAMQALRSSLALEDSVRFDGPVSDDAKWDLYADADLFVLPTLSENFGLVVAEALSSELPVITTRAAPWSELGLRRCGWWVDTGVEALTMALRDAVSRTDAERKDMGRRGRALVQECYAWPAIAAEMRAVYDWRLGRRPIPACVDPGSA